MRTRGMRFESREGGSTSVGFVAQELEAVLPEAVSTGADGYKSVDYARVTPVLVEALKAERRRTDELSRRLDDLGARQRKLEEQLATLLSTR